MQMQGSRQLSATAQQAWEALNDPEVLKQCVPGCQKFELESENVYHTAAAIKIGPVSAKFTGKVELSDIQPPKSYTLKFEAQGGVAGHGKGVSHVELVENDQGVELKYTVESQIGGKLAQLGQRLIDGAAKSMADDFFKRFEKALSEKTGHSPSDETSTHEEAASESTASTAGASGTASASSNAGVPRWLWIAVAAAVAVVIAVMSSGS
ncbi:CoxG family protein [Orrella daihaiensis]|uniref:Carbon monoxide dehydrogenase subunit G n=1 Tax=Orrella daihaiensis TaxID=2782176 RepID=A0ABY4APD2_9BURK|nr:carbon monoxide dehydrogenase subunit G [Orrella daihaiensis]UOD50920.1 carbon monoxide dehydrogenase subunit G [Orrella daihaiensis]